MFWGQNIIKHMKCSPWRKNKETALRALAANKINTLIPGLPGLSDTPQHGLSLGLRRPGFRCQLCCLP